MVTRYCPRATISAWESCFGPVVVSAFCSAGWLQPNWEKEKQMMKSEKITAVSSEAFFMLQVLVERVKQNCSQRQEVFSQEGLCSKKDKYFF
jgi:hypothetical protein